MNVRKIQRSAGTLLALLFILGAVGSCNRRPPKSQIDEAAYVKEIDKYRSDRIAELKGETGWLTLIGLFWLKEGGNTFGRHPSMDIVLSKDKVPSSLGVIIVTHDGMCALSVPNPALTIDGKSAASLLKNNSEANVDRVLPLKTDADNKPTILHLGSLSFQIIKRGDKLGLRVRDKDNPDRAKFQGTEWYPADLKWRIDAKFEPYNPPKPMPVTNVLGMETGESSPGAIVFEVDGQTYRLDALTEKDEPRLFMIVADKTNGKETYPAGRYLYVERADAGGHVVIDFNKAYSPPCAFTKFATCPLPPGQNRLPFAIGAGEKYNTLPH